MKILNGVNLFLGYSDNMGNKFLSSISRKKTNVNIENMLLQYCPIKDSYDRYKRNSPLYLLPIIIDDDDLVLKLSQ